MIMENVKHYGYQEAKKKVGCLKSFYMGLVAYLVFIPLMALVNYWTNPFPWVIFPAVAWGFGLLMWWVTEFGPNPLLGRSWEARKIKKFMEDNEF